MHILIEKPLCFEINKDILRKHDRLDVHFLHPHYLGLEQRLEKGPYELKTLAQISKQIVCGSTPKDYNLFAQKGIIFLKTVNVQDGTLNLKDKYYISVSSHNKRKYSEVRKGDLLLTIIGANEEVVGRIVLIRENIMANINQNIAKLRIKDEILSKYIEAFLYTNIGRDLILQKSRIATRVNMNLKEVASIKIPLPPKNIQEKIIKIMEDAKKRKKRNLEKVKKVRKELNYSFLKELGLEYPEEKEENIFIVAELGYRFDPYHFHPRFVRIINSLKNGKFKLSKLKNVAKFSNEQIDPNKEPNRLFKYIQIQNIDERNHKISSYTHVLGKDAPGRARMLIKEGDILLPILGGSSKSIAFVSKEFDKEVGSNGFAILRIHDKNLKYYVFYYLTSKFAQMQIERQLTGAIMSSVTKSELEDLFIPIPSSITVERVVKRIKEVNKTIEILQEEADDVIKKSKEKVEKMILGE